MKKFNYYYDYSPEAYNYIMQSKILRQSEKNMLNKRVNYPLGYGNQNTNYTNGQFIILSCNCLNKRGTESQVGL